MLTGPSLSLEVLNGAVALLELFFLVALGVYLRRESVDRHLRWRNLFHFDLPSHMAFALAVFVADAGILVRSLVIWQWRRFHDSGPFTEAESSLLWFGAALIVLGSIYKIRSLTRPVYGMRPWIVALAAVVAFAFVTLAWR